MHFHPVWHGFMLGFGLMVAAQVVVYLVWRVRRKPPSGDAK